MVSEYIRTAKEKLHAVGGKFSLAIMTALSREADSIFDHILYQPPSVLPGELQDFTEETIHSHGTTLGLWVREPVDNTKPVYVVFHGRRGSWDRAGAYDAKNPSDPGDLYRLEWLKEIAATGAHVIAVHMRCHGASRHHGDHQISERHLEHDIKAIADYLADYLQQRRMSSKQVIVAGESMGGALAPMLAEELTKRQHPPAVLGLVTTFESMTDMIHWNLQNVRIGGIRIGKIFDALSTEDVKKMTDNHLNTAARISTLNPHDTSLYIAAVQGDEHIPPHQHEKLCKAAADRGFTVESGTLKISEWGNDELWKPAGDRHTAWNHKKVVENLQALYEARQAHKVNGHAGTGHAAHGWTSMVHVGQNGNGRHF